MVNLLNPRYSLPFLVLIGGAYLLDNLSIQDLIVITRNKMIETDVNITWELITQKIGINQIIKNVTEQYPNIFENICLSQFPANECQNNI